VASADDRSVAVAAAMTVRYTRAHLPTLDPTRFR
jgi:hypothetical protein